MGERTMAAFTFTLILSFSFQIYPAPSIPFPWVPTRKCLRLVASFWVSVAPSRTNSGWLGIYPQRIGNSGCFMWKLLFLFSVLYMN